MNLINYLSYPQEAYPGDHILQMLKNSLKPNQGITPRCLKDPILVSIDVGLGQRGCLDTIGIACLDSRFLTGPPTEDSITTRLLLLRRRSLPSNQRTLQYLFGIPERSPPEAAREILQAIFRQFDHEQGRLRNIFLVGHNIYSDIRYLENTIGFIVASIPSIIAIIDTQQLSRRVFNFRHKYISLQLLLSILGIKARQLHNSGNDAVYTLKALIRLFCSYQTDAIEQSKLFVRPSHCVRDERVELLWRERLESLRQAANCCPRPILLREARRAARQPKPPRVGNPDLFQIDAASDGEMKGVMMALFGDDS